MAPNHPPPTHRLGRSGAPRMGMGGAGRGFELEGPEVGSGGSGEHCGASSPE